MEVVLHDKEADAPGADLVLGSNNEEQGAIIESDAAIGMLSLAWLNKDVKGLSIIGKNKERVDPTLMNVRSKTFPIIRDLQIVTDGAATGDLKKFIDFIQSPRGQEIVEEKGFLKIHE
jgi:phosphate transport system substrate-binding protein